MTHAAAGRLLVFDTSRMAEPIANIEVIEVKTDTVAQTYNVGGGPNGITVR